MLRPGQSANFTGQAGREETGRSPPALTCELNAEEEQRSTRKALAIHEDTQPWPPRPDRPTEGSSALPGPSWERARAPACSQSRGSPSPKGLGARAPVTHPCSAGALCWNERWGLSSNALLPSFLPPLLPPSALYARSKSAQSPQAQSSASRLLWAPACGWPRSSQEAVPGCPGLGPGSLPEAGPGLPAR